MSGPLQALVALDDEVDRGLVDTLVAGRANATVLDYLEIGGSTGSGYGAGDVLIVACADYTAEVRTYIEEAGRQHPSRPIVLLGPAGNNGYLRDAFSSGVDDIIALPTEHGGEVDDALVDQLTFTLEKVVVKKRDMELGKPVRQSRVICVLGLKGGAGKTLTAVNLGVALADKGHTVALVDIDLQFGDLALAMALSPDRTIYDLVRSGGSLDAEKLQDFLAEHPSGARALLSPLRPDQAGAIKVPFVREVMRLLCDMHEYVIVDTPPSFTPEVIAAVDMSTEVLLVAMRDTLSLKNTKLGLETLQRMGYDGNAIRVVLNRANTKVGIEHHDIVGILGRDVDVLIPSHRDITRSINQGTPIALASGSAGRAFHELADLYRDPAKASLPRARRPLRRPRRVRPPAPEGEPAPPSEAQAEGHQRRRRFARRRG